MNIYFISDAHLGMPNPVRPPEQQEAALIAFLRSIRSDAEALYILGDLFDFWFEFRSVVPAQGARVLFELYNLVQTGVRVVYLPGNHDLFQGPFLSRCVGLVLPGESVSVTHQDRRLFLTHGDSFRNDLSFRVSRGVLKNSLARGLFRLVHPDVGMWLARCTSRWSNGGARCAKRDEGALRAGAAQRIAEGHDLVVCGHFHRPMIENLDGGKLVVLGDWIREDSYGVLSGGKMELKRWGS